jgi:uncharacterized membrane protein YfcA
LIQKKGIDPRHLSFLKDFAFFSGICFLVYLIGYLQWSFLLVLIPLIMYVVRCSQKARKREKVSTLFLFRVSTYFVTGKYVGVGGHPHI